MSVRPDPGIGACMFWVKVSGEIFCDPTPRSLGASDLSPHLTEQLVQHIDAVPSCRRLANLCHVGLGPRMTRTTLAEFGPESRCMPQPAGVSLRFPFQGTCTPPSPGHHAMPSRRCNAPRPVRPLGPNLLRRNATRGRVSEHVGSGDLAQSWTCSLGSRLIAFSRDPCQGSRGGEHPDCSRCQRASSAYAQCSHTDAGGNMARCVGSGNGVALGRCGTWRAK